MTREANAPARPPLPLPAAAPLVAPPSFVEEIARFGVVLDEAKVRSLGDYLARLLAMSSLLNLTAIKDPSEAWTRHAVDSLALVPQLAHLQAGGRVIDIGSGGGLPGIPLAIARPDLEVVLVEATQKKASFLSAVSEAIGLANVTVVANRAEALHGSDLAGAFDVVTARAVAKLEALVPWTAPFARPGGHLMFIKGERAPDELRDAKNVLARFRCTHERTVVGSTGRIVVLKVD